MPTDLPEPASAEESEIAAMIAEGGPEGWGSTFRNLETELTRMNKADEDIKLAFAVSTYPDLDFTGAGASAGRYSRARSAAGSIPAARPRATSSCVPSSAARGETTSSSSTTTHW